MRDYHLILVERVNYLSRSKIFLSKVEKSTHVQAKEHMVQELEGQTIKGAESPTRSPLKGRCYRRTDIDMVARCEPYHGATKFLAVVAGGLDNGLSLFLVEMVLGDGMIAARHDGSHPRSFLSVYLSKRGAGVFEG
ncbi:hypothetical protein MN608_09312 [Microdochium nivale]|nr:hypothetical protein MN608_09312 [Microdochium nivale]